MKSGAVKVGPWLFRIVASVAWRSITFTGRETRFSIAAPVGQIIAEARINPDGTLSIVVFDDHFEAATELTTVRDAEEAERARLEAEREARGEGL